MSVAALVKQWQEGFVGEAEFVSRLNKLDLALFAHGKLLHWEGNLGGWNVVNTSNLENGIQAVFLGEKMTDASFSAVSNDTERYVREWYELDKLSGQVTFIRRALRDTPQWVLDFDARYCK